MKNHKSHLKNSVWSELFRNWLCVMSDKILQFDDSTAAMISHIQWSISNSKSHLFFPWKAYAQQILQRHRYLSSYNAVYVVMRRSSISYVKLLHHHRHRCRHHRHRHQVSPSKKGITFVLHVFVLASRGVEADLDVRQHCSPENYNRALW